MKFSPKYKALLCPYTQIRLLCLEADYIYSGSLIEANNIIGGGNDDWPMGALPGKFERLYLAVKRST